MESKNQKKPLPEHCEPNLNKKSFFVMKTKESANLNMDNVPFPKDLPYEYLITKFPENILEGFVVKDSTGIYSTDKEVVEKQSGLIKDVLGQLVKNIGGSSMSLSLPVKVFEPRTMLERITDWFAFAPKIMKEASQLNDNVEVLKKVICLGLSSLFRSTQQLKPFNPMLGETYQGHWEDGTKIYLEHTSHIPPVSHFLIEDKEKTYRLSGYFMMAMEGIFKSLITNTMYLVPKGRITVKFNKTGQTIEFQFPKISLGGILYGERYILFNGMMKFEDRKNNLKSIICFNKSRKEIKNKRCHDIYGRILNYDFKKFNDLPLPADKYYESNVPSHPFPKHEEGMLCEITGSWLEDIKFNNQVYYSIKNSHCLQLYPDEICLDSDSRFREDKKWMKYAWNFPDYNSLYMEYCQAWKLALEAQQRYERFLRNNVSNTPTKK